MKSKNVIAQTVSIVVLAFVTTGCETFTNGSPASKKKKKDASWTFFKKKEYQVPQSMNVTWAHDVITLPGKAPTRGFGGRFYFYNEKTQAIPVDGDLVVYGFDDTNKPPIGGDDLNQADKRFRFTAEQFTSHFSEGELGASYSVWIPWDEAGNEPKKIMLIPTFITKEGRLIRGESANVNLPGKAVDENTPGLIRQASANIPTALPGQLSDARHTTQPPIHANPAVNDFQSPQSGLRTTTIQLPSSMLRNQSSTANTDAVVTAMQNQPAFQDQFELQHQMLQSVQRQMNGNSNTAPNNSVANASPNDAFNANQSLAAPLAQRGSSHVQLTTQPLLNPPTAMPLMRATTNTNSPNGWALPEFAQSPYSGLGSRSSPNPLPVPATQAVQQASYQSR